ncbi:uncharacterized protein V6R79_020400 [Siganus canaliculatus]
METAEQSELQKVCEEADSPEHGKDFSAHDKQVCIESDQSESTEENTKGGKLSSNLQADFSETIYTKIHCQDKKEALLLESVHGNMNESITSCPFERLSSVHSVCVNDVDCRSQEIEEQDSQQELVPEQNNVQGQVPEPEISTAQEQDPEPGIYSELEQDPEPERNSDLEKHPESDQYPELEGEPELYLNTELNPEGHTYQNLTETHSVPEESILELCIREETMSDVSNDGHNDHNPDKMDECLKVEFSAASSDTETDEKWRAIFSSSINKEDDDSYLDSLQLSAQDLFVQRVGVTDFEEPNNSNFEQFSLEVPQEEILEQPGDLISFPTPQAVKYNPLGLQSLSKISEDENENDRDTLYDQQHGNGNQNKMLPKDFCVIQETKNENVSTEHVDFQLARKQWREMEEQSKKKTAIPSTKQFSFHASHSVLHTPVRNIEGIQKRGHDLQNLNLIADFHHSQVSPCSEDSGLDDPSYKSPQDDAETPVERKICVSMEMKENLSRDKGHSRVDRSTDCGPFHSIPRSVITPLTPSFIITPSPTKEPKHEASTNNVIILETANLIIRSVSDLSLNQDCEQSQEKMFLNNPFFKLRSRSTMSLVDEEIKMVKQREEELKKERANLYGRDRFDTDRMLSSHMDPLVFLNSGMIQHVEQTPFTLVISVCV